MGRNFLLCFGLLGGINLFAVWSDHYWLEVMSKSLLMPALMGYCVFVTWTDPGLKKLVITSLVFSWIGDVALLFQSQLEAAFLVGLGSFLVAHVVYTLANYRTGISFSLAFKPFIIAVILMGGGLAFVYVLDPFLGPMKIPVAVYATVIVTMGVTTGLRAGHTNSISYWVLVGGAVFFILSDAMIALNKFYQPFDYSSIGIMFTYLYAQFLLIKGYHFHQEP